MIQAVVKGQLFGDRKNQANSPAPLYNIRMNQPATGTAALAGRIGDALPQTQCRLCGFDGCKPYAEAVAAGRASINRCPPGGDDTLRELARLTGLPPVPLDPACAAAGPPAVAVIDEPACIGCTLCIQACPVDAIAGASKRMHTVIADECTGCGLCVPPCPVDCIAMIEISGPAAAGTRRQRAPHYKKRHAARLDRLERERVKQDRRKTAEQKKRAAIERAMERARRRLSNRQD